MFISLEAINLLGDYVKEKLTLIGQNLCACKEAKQGHSMYFQLCSLYN